MYLVSILCSFVLIIAVAAAAVYFLMFRKKQDTTTTVPSSAAAAPSVSAAVASPPQQKQKAEEDAEDAEEEEQDVQEEEESEEEVAEPYVEDIDCMLSPWGECSVNTQTRTVVKAPSGKGKACDTALSQNCTTSYLKLGETLPQDVKLYSPNGLYYLIMQADGNLVLYGPDKVYFATNTDNKKGVGPFKFKFVGSVDVENTLGLVVEGSQGGTYFAGLGNAEFYAKNPTAGKAVKLQVTDDGKLMLLDANNNALWSLN